MGAYETRDFIAVRRRDFLILAAAAVPIRAAAETRSRPLFGLLSEVAADDLRYLPAFFDRLHELHYQRNHDFDLVSRFADGHSERLAALAGELANLNPDLILATNTAAAAAAKGATSTIPIVAPLLVNPVGAGLAASQARPGGNVTGILYAPQGFATKFVELAAELVPGAAAIGVLSNPGNPASVAALRDIESAHLPPSMRVIVSDVKAPEEIDHALLSLFDGHAAAVIMLPDLMLTSVGTRIIALASAKRIPVLGPEALLIKAGAVATYGIYQKDSWRRAADYVDLILKGRRPADLPIEFPTRLELIINAKSAKALGLTIPLSLIARADQVVE